MNAISSLTGAASQTLGAAGNNSLGQNEFLQILMTQLQNQDPLNPMDDQSFIAQMAQFSTLEATNNLGDQLKQVLGAQQQSQALSLIGKDITYTDASGQPAQGKVGGVRLDTNPPMLVIGKQEVPVGWVTGVL